MKLFFLAFFSYVFSYAAAVFRNLFTRALVGK